MIGNEHAISGEGGHGYGAASRGSVQSCARLATSPGRGAERSPLRPILRRNPIWLPDYLQLKNEHNIERRSFCTAHPREGRCLPRS
jgi:hypothetical protein